MSLLAVDAAEIFKWIGYIVVAMLCFMFMIVVHELGHYTAGKLLGFRINEFSVGFGPAILQRKKKSGEVFSIRCIPAGGFCAFEGEDEEESERPDAFNAKPVWKRIIVLAAGVTFNFVSAIVILNFFFMGYGEAVPRVNTAHEYTDGAEQPFEEGDMILSIDGEKMYCLIDPGKLQAAFADGKAHTVEVMRNGEKIVFEAGLHEYVLEETDDSGATIETEQTGLGLSYSFAPYKLNYGEALGRSFTFSGEVVKLTFKAIGQLFTGDAKVGDTMGGTVTAVSALVELTQSGAPAIAYGVAVLSLSIALMNILPLPALDGMRIVFAAIEGIRRKPLNRKVEAIIHTIGLFLLLGLAITFDLLHFFG